MKENGVDNPEETNQATNKKKGNRQLVIGIVGVVSVSLLIFMVFGVSAIKKNKIIKQADAFIAMERFEDGIAIYDNILSDDYSNDIMAKRDAAIELMESDENFKKGLEAFEDENINKAIKYLSKVPKSDKKRYEKALAELKDIEEATIMEVDELIESEDLDKAIKIVNTYLKAAPDNIKMQNAKDSINAKYTEAEKQAKAEEEDRKNKETEAITAAKNAEAEAINTSKNAEISQRKRDEIQSTANNIIGSYKSIIAKEANLREAPTLKSRVLVTLSRGTNVYIHDTQIESSDRIWCLVNVEGYSESGWISYNTMNYTMQ